MTETALVSSPAARLMRLHPILGIAKGEEMKGRIKEAAGDITGNKESTASTVFWSN